MVGELPPSAVQASQALPFTAKIVHLRPHANQEQFGRRRTDAGAAQHLDLARLRTYLIAHTYLFSSKL
jgi:hypothetical protein